MRNYKHLKMRILFIFSIFQLFIFEQSKIAKELPSYDKIEVVNNETVYLKTDMYKEGKEILLYFVFLNYTQDRVRALHLNYCFSNQIEENSCTFRQEKFDDDRDYLHNGDKLYFFPYIYMRNTSRYLLFNAYLEGSKQIIIYHYLDPPGFAREPDNAYEIKCDNTTILYANSFKEFLYKNEDEFFYLITFDSNEEIR